jgi:hypothetical protein
MGGDKPVPDLRHGGLFQQVASSAGDREERVGRNVDQPGVAQHPGQGASV